MDGHNTSTARPLQSRPNLENRSLWPVVAWMNFPYPITWNFCLPSFRYLWNSKTLKPIKKFVYKGILDNRHFVVKLRSSHYRNNLNFLLLSNFVLVLCWSRDGIYGSWIGRACSYGTTIVCFFGVVCRESDQEGSVRPLLAKNPPCPLTGYLAWAIRAAMTDRCPYQTLSIMLTALWVRLKELPWNTTRRRLGLDLYRTVNYSPSAKPRLR